MRYPFGQLPESKSFLPHPAIVIAVGDVTVPVASQVRNIYLRGDMHREEAITFYQLHSDEAGKLVIADLVEQELPNSSPNSVDAWLEERQAAFRNTVNQAADIKGQLAHILHEERIHQRILLAGWGEEFNVPLNIFLLANVKDAWSAGVLLPFGAILNSAAERTNSCQCHWLLDISVFPENTPNQELEVWSLLKALDDYLRPDSKECKKLSDSLDLQPRQTPDFSVFLFDYRKEGTALVKDQRSLNTSMGNGLLALLQEDLAGKFYSKRDLNAMYEYGSYYGSLGAVALIYDPNALQMACARRASYHFIQDKLLCPPLDGQKGVLLADEIGRQTGEISAWLGQICTKLPSTIGLISLENDPMRMTANLADLHLSDLDYQKVNQTAWIKEFQGHRDNFDKVVLPEIRKQLEANEKEVRKGLLIELNSSLDDLPLNVDLYPGGIQNARASLESLGEKFRKSFQNLTKLKADLAGEFSATLADFNTKCQQMDQVLSKAPALPWWIRIMPSFIRKWLAMGWMTLKYGHMIFLAKKMQEECVALFQLICGLQIEQDALFQLEKIPSRLQVEVNKTKKALKVFEDKLVGARNSFSMEWGDFPLGLQENGVESVFRQGLTIKELSEWAEGLSASLVGHTGPDF
jgi:hypothetical protein